MGETLMSDHRMLTSNNSLHWPPDGHGSCSSCHWGWQQPRQCLGAIELTR